MKNQAAEDHRLDLPFRTRIDGFLISSITFSSFPKFVAGGFVSGAAELGRLSRTETCCFLPLFLLEKKKIHG